MRFALIGSGKGSNARAVLEAWRRGELADAQPVGILSDKPDAPILGFGKTYGVPALPLPTGPYRTRLSDEAERRFVAQLRAWETDWVVLAGFMRVLHEPLLEAYGGRMINLHPSLLPSFPGLQPIKKALDFGVKVTGCTVHLVTADLDAGPILDQAIVRIDASDTIDTLTAKIHAAEHQLLPSVIARIARGELP